MKISKAVALLRLFTLLAVAVASIGLSGCISGKGVNPTISGRAGQKNVVERIKPGVSKDFILGLLGEPAKKTTEEGGAEVWQWPYIENRQDVTVAIFLFASVTENQTEKLRFVEFKDGVVTRTWSN